MFFQYPRIELISECLLFMIILLILQVGYNESVHSIPTYLFLHVGEKKSPFEHEHQIVRFSAKASTLDLILYNFSLG